MRILRCIYRQEQKSLLRAEKSEMRALFEIEHNGHVGNLRYDADYDKRDFDSAIYCDIPGVTTDTFANEGPSDGFYIDEEVWQHEPEYTHETPEIKEEIIRLTNYQITE